MRTEDFPETSLIFRENVFKKEEIWPQRTFSKIFGRTLIGRWLLFSYRGSFLYIGMMSANFRIKGNVCDLIDLLTWSNIKGEKKSIRFVLNFF